MHPRPCPVCGVPCGSSVCAECWDWAVEWGEYAARGLTELEAFLAHHGEFAAWLVENGLQPD